MNPEYTGIARESFQNGFKMFLKVWYLKKCYKTGINQNELSMGIYIVAGAMTWYMLFGRGIILTNQPVTIFHGRELIE